MRQTFARDSRAVTPVIGGIMILGITVAGMVAALYWGGPELQKLDERGAQVAMIGEFREIRRDTLVLSLSDSARVPVILLEKGDLRLVDGTRIQIAATFDDLAANAAGCSVHVTKVGVGGNNDQFAVSAPGCSNFKASGDDALTCTAPAQCLRVYKVTGSNLNGARATLVSSSGDDYVFSVSDGSPSVLQDLTASSWLFEVGKDGTAPARGAAWADIWSLKSLGIEWTMPGLTDVSVYYEAGAIFSGRQGTISLMDAPPMDEEAYLTQDYVWRLPTMTGDYDGLSAPATAHLFVGLVGSDQRTSRDDVDNLRLDFDGRYSEAWCNTMILRNQDLRFGTYTEDPSFTCTTGASGVRSVTYSAVDDVGAPTTFPFELFHARITTNL